MGGGAKIGLLGYAGPGANLHSPETVSVSTITEAGLVVQGEIPGVIDTGPLVHKRQAEDRGPEAAQDEKPPGVEGLRSPAAKERPCVLPQQQSQAVVSGPGAGIATGLVVGVQISHHSDEGALLDHLLKATQKLSGNSGGIMALANADGGL